MTRIRYKALAVAAAAAFVAMACGGNSGGGQAGSDTLAQDQTFRFPLQDDIATLDPGHAESAVDITFIQNTYSGLYGFDNSLKVVPVIATGSPDVSSDGKTYTFKMRHDVKFSNGDPVKSKDVLYSWNRAAYLNDSYASVFDPVVGGGDTQTHKSKTMSGLTAPDDYTVKAVLTDPAGYWLTELALWTASVVDQKVIEQADGADPDKQSTWWTKPETAVGTGPFKMTERTAKASMAFQPVANWWGGSTGALKNIKVEIGVDQTSQVKKYESGGYDHIGMANNGIGPDDVLRYKNDPTKAKDLALYPAARTTWVGFNYAKGPFQGAAGKDGRQAFSFAIDRDQLVDVACSHGATCQKATGGGIAKGLKGYLGDGKDTNAVFNKDQAKSLYGKWDADGKKVAGLQYRYNTNSSNTKIAQNLQSQWQANLGLKVELAPSDFPTLIKDRKAKNAIIFRGSWGADYDHPQDWFDNLWNCAQAAPGKGGSEGYCNQDMDKLLTQANTQSIDKAESLYKQAGEMMIKDVVDANITYGVNPTLTKSYVKGYGYNSLYDNLWTGIKIVQHS